MDILQVLFILIAAVIIITGIYYGYTGVVRSINDDAYGKYQYKPINFMNGLMSIGPLGIALLGWGNFENNNSYMVGSLAVALFGTIILIGSIAKKTDWRTATATVTVLYVGLILLFVFILAIFLMFFGEGKKEKSK